VPLQLFACERPIGWAAIGVGLLVVSELVAVEQRAIARIVDAAIGRHMGHDALRLALFGLFTVRIARVGDYVECFRITRRRFGRFRHR